jgi:hypothetical protein
VRQEEIILRDDLVGALVNIQANEAVDTGRRLLEEGENPLWIGAK